MSKPRIIKKYPNRCLYDTGQSKYISLADLKELVIQGEAFEVREVKTDKDITRLVLLQIISEEEDEGTPMFSTEMLTRFIRMYGASMQGVFSDYMEQSMQAFDQQARSFFDQIGESMGSGSPMTAWADLAKQNMSAWQEAQKNMMRAAGLAGDDKDKE